MIYLGIDAGSVNGALGAINHNGEYVDSFMIEHKDKHICALVFKSRILSVVDPKEGAQICMEQVHAMPKQGISSTWNFARAVGVISAVCELTNYPFHLVSPQKWKKHFNLTADKNEALDLARKLFPKAPLRLKKDINRAEALLIAEYWRQQTHG
jgi:Holliday junction resolvasome RuvABC endonuclease subunit